MYRDDESAAAEHAAELEELLATSLEPLVVRAARMRVHKWHGLLPAVVLMPLALAAPTGGHGMMPLRMLALHAGSSSVPIWIAVMVALIATGLVGGLFFGLTHLASRARVARVRRHFAPPSRDLRATERIAQLTRTLARLRVYVESSTMADIPKDVPG
jgi:hypothetical protein